MSVAIRAITRLQDADDLNVTLGAGVDEYALSWDNDTARFVLRAPFAGLLATGATTGATSQAQAFTNGIIGPSWKPSADSTTALQLQNASGTSVLNVDTTNARVGIGTTAPTQQLQIVGTGGLYVGDSAHLNSYLTDFASNALSAKGLGVLIDDAAKYAMAFQNIASGGYGLNIYANSSGTERLLAISNSSSDAFNFLGNGRLGIGTTAPATRLDIDAGALTMKEMTAPTGVADKAMLYTKDNGSGKTQLCVKLGDDVEIVIATQS